MKNNTRGYPDLHEHLESLKAQGLLLTIDEPIDKDAEMHALVRWQFVGGMEEKDRKAFLFTNIRDGRGRKYDMPVVVGAIAANRAIYSIGMGAPVEQIQAKWDRAIAQPIMIRIGGVRQEATLVGAGAATVDIPAIVLSGREK